MISKGYSTVHLSIPTVLMESVDALIRHQLFSSRGAYFSSLLRQDMSRRNKKYYTTCQVCGEDIQVGLTRILEPTSDDEQSETVACQSCYEGEKVNNQYE